MSARRLFKQVLVVSVLAATACAQAATVTFSIGEDLKYLWGSRVLGDGTTYWESGMYFTSAYGKDLFSWAMTVPANADLFGSTLLENGYGDTVTATLEGGAGFTLNSFDLADAQNVGAVGNIPFSYTDATGSHSELLALPGTPGLKTYHFDLVGVTSFTLMEEAPGFQIDNVIFNEPLAAVPEPGDAGLLVAGLAALGLAARPKRVRYKALK